MAPEEIPDIVEPVEDVSEHGVPALPPSDPRKMTSRERNRKLILLALLILLLLLLSYLAYFYMMNRRLPTLGLAPAGSDYVQPPSYLYSIAGTGPSAMVRPVGLGVAKDGRVYVVDFGNRRVSVFTNAGRYLFSFDTTPDGKLINAVHLAIKGNEVWVSERYHHAIYIFDLQGTYLRKFEPLNEKLVWTPLAFSFDASGALRVTDVYNTNLHRLLYFSTEGSRTAAVGKTAQVNALQEQPGSFMFPDGVAVAANGDVYVSDGDNRRVQVFGPTGAFKRFVDTSGVPRGIAVDGKQRLYVADALAHTITVFDDQGKSLTQFGERGFGPGQFNYPNDIALDRGGRIYITDRENNQVQVWGWPVAQLPKIPIPNSPWAWLAAAACCLPFLLIPPLLFARRKIRIVVTPEFMDSLAAADEIKSVSERSRLVLVAPIEDRPLYEGQEVDGVNLVQLLTFDDYSESDARALKERLKVAQRSAMLLAMGWRAKALATDDQNLRLLALLAEVRTVDIDEFREIYLNREKRSSEA